MQFSGVNPELFDVSNPTVRKIVCKLCYSTSKPVRTCESCDSTFYCSSICQTLDLVAHHCFCSTRMTIQRHLLVQEATTIMERYDRLRGGGDIPLCRPTCPNNAENNSSFILHQCQHRQCAKCSLDNNTGPTIICRQCGTVERKELQTNQMEIFISLLAIQSLPRNHALIPYFLELIGHVRYAVVMLHNNMGNHKKTIYLLIFQRALTLYFEDKFVEAYNVVKVLLKYFPSNPGTYFIAIPAAYEAAVENSIIKNIIERAMEAVSGIDEYFYRISLTKMVADYTMRITHDAGQWGQAISLGRDLLELDATMMYPYLYVADSFLALGKLKEAAVVLQRGIDYANPSIAKAKLPIVEKLQSVKALIIRKNRDVQQKKKKK